MFQKPSADLSDGQATIFQTEKALKTRKVERNTIADGLPAELYKCGYTANREYFHHLF